MKNIISNNFIIGAVHFPALLGYDEFPGLEIAYKNAVTDIQAFEQGGANAIIIENNYDLPHTETVSASIVASLSMLATQLKETTNLPMGISVLWNDYEAALSIAKLADLDFVRVPVFVDSVKTDYGIITGNPEKVTTYRKKIDAEDVAIFADIHVKHAEIVSDYTLLESAQKAAQHGANGLIITGQWTGDAPMLEDFKLLQDGGIELPLIVGSGLNHENATELMNTADGAIVSTALKESGNEDHEINVKGYASRISEAKVSQLVKLLVK